MEAVPAASPDAQHEPILPPSARFASARPDRTQGHSSGKELSSVEGEVAAVVAPTPGSAGLR